MFYLLVRVAVQIQSREARMTAGSTSQVRRSKNDRGDTSGGFHFYFVYIRRALTRFMTVADGSAITIRQGTIATRPPTTTFTTTTYAWLVNNQKDCSSAQSRDLHIGACHFDVLCVFPMLYVCVFLI